MSRKSTSNAEAETASDRTEPMDVAPALTEGLLAGWQGVYHLLGGRVESWEILPNEGIAAHGFTLDGQFDVDTVLTDLNRYNRRVQLFPTIDWINGAEPAPFENPTDVQAYLTQYFKGSTGDGSTKAAKYIRDAAKVYRTANMNVNKPGPRPQALKKLASIDVNSLREIDISAEEVEKLEAIMAAVRSRASETASNAEATPA